MEVIISGGSVDLWVLIVLGVVAVVTVVGLVYAVALLLRCCFDRTSSKGSRAAKAEPSPIPMTRTSSTSGSSSRGSVKYAQEKRFARSDSRKRTAEFSKPPSPPVAKATARGAGASSGAIGSSSGIGIESTRGSPPRLHEPRSDQLQIWMLDDVRKATRHFADDIIVADDGFATTYEGLGPPRGGAPGGLRAVKRFKARPANASRRQSLKNLFEDEVARLFHLNHRNIVKILGMCAQEHELVMIQEHSEYGSLETHILKKYTGRRPPPTLPEPLSFLQRLDIAVGVAEALHYMHDLALPPMVHGDLTLASIELDAELRAKVSEFAPVKRLVESHADVDDTCPPCLNGTYGYVDPEYSLTMSYAPRGDVYSFGVVLLQLFTARPAVMDTGVEQAATAVSSGGSSLADGEDVFHMMRSDSETIVNIGLWIKPYMKEGRLEGVVDPTMGSDYPRNALLQVLELALKCQRMPGKRRPTMADVVRSLKTVRNTLKLNLALPAAGGAGGGGSTGGSGGPTDIRSVASLERVFKPLHALNNGMGTDAADVSREGASRAVAEAVAETAAVAAAAAATAAVAAATAATTVGASGQGSGGNVGGANLEGDGDDDASEGGRVVRRRVQWADNKEPADEEGVLTDGEGKAKQGQKDAILTTEAAVTIAVDDGWEAGGEELEGTVIAPGGKVKNIEV